MNVARSFDLAARLSTQTDSSGTFAWSYTPWNGLPAAITNLDCGLSVAYEYDVLDRPAGIVWRKSDGDILRAFRYLYDMAGCITNLLMEGEALPSRRTLYGYDMLDRLIAETTAGRTNAWSYDLADNRTNAVLNGASTACTLGIGDRLASTSDGATYLYSAAGCVTNISVPSVSSVVSLSWNSQCQLTAAYTNGALAESYQYDALSRRISTISGGITNYHVYDDNWQVLADLDASGQPLRTYTWAPGIDHLLAMTVYTETATNTYYAITDHLGTVHALVDAAGDIAESYEFDAWGNGTVYDDSRLPIPDSRLGNRYLFQGREYSYSTGLYHFRHRWYDFVTGRWLSNDPIGISGGMNQYVFCANEPIYMVDPFGLWTIGGHRALVKGGVKGLALSEAQVDRIQDGAAAADSRHGAPRFMTLWRHSYRRFLHLDDPATPFDDRVIAGGLYYKRAFALYHEKSATDKQRQAALFLLGTALHAYQDVYAHGRAQGHGLFAGHDKPRWNEPRHRDFLGYSWAGNRHGAAQTTTTSLLHNFFNP